MQEDVANHVYGIISYGLNLKERLDRGDMPDFDAEQNKLKGMLLSELESNRLADFGADRKLDSSFLGGSRTGGSLRRTSETFLGIRYTLVCWLDEIFIVDSPWAADWNEHKLESTLYGSNDRAFGFWEQADRAMSRPGSDALEVFYLCVMLGFRGDMREQPEKLRQWCDSVRDRVNRSQAREFPLPAEIQAPTNVPPRFGADRVRRMFLFASFFALIILAVVVFLVVKGNG